MKIISSTKQLEIIALLLIVLFSACNLVDKNSDIKFLEGGYNFKKTIDSKDSTFPYYPLKDKIHPRDSFDYAFYQKEFFKVFNEPNISLKPSKKPVFRFVYRCWTCPAFIITLNESKIVIKEGLQVNYFLSNDSMLSDTEKLLLQIFEKRYPIAKNDTSLKEFTRKNLDSLITIYPMLLDRNYYDTLVHKKYRTLQRPFRYRTIIKAISNEQYSEIINLINRSGYWKMPLHTYCYNAPNDGYDFSLEANNGSKYNLVNSGSCGDGPTAFDTICQALINTANLGNKIKITNY